MSFSKKKNDQTAKRITWSKIHIERLSSCWFKIAQETAKSNQKMQYLKMQIQYMVEF